MAAQESAYTPRPRPGLSTGARSRQDAHNERQAGRRAGARSEKALWDAGAGSYAELLNATPTEQQAAQHGKLSSAPPGEHQCARGIRARSAQADSTAPGARDAPRFFRSRLTSTYVRPFRKISHSEGRPVRAEAVKRQSVRGPACAGMRIWLKRPCTARCTSIKARCAVSLKSKARSAE
jgi:hypothetical protein